MKNKVVFVLGAPGTGKGTQCELLANNFQSLQFLSAGELLREERQNKDSKIGIVYKQVS